LLRRVWDKIILVIKTVKETIASIQDVKYRQVLWYWTKYLIFISVIPLIIGVLAFTRYLPESPKFIQDKFPEGRLTVKNHQMITTITEPYKVGNQDFTLIIDAGGDAKELDTVTNGILLLKDKVVIKTPDNQLDIQDYTKIPDFSTDKTEIYSWVSGHLFHLWLGGVAGILILGIIGFIFSWVFRIAVYGLWALIFWILGKYLLKKTLTYLQSLSVVLYASIIQLVLSLFLAIAPNQLLEALGTVLFVYFTFTWIRNLPETASPVISSPLPVLSESQPLPKPRSRKTK
jgi:hypothetical protein